ncbi:MAG: hypothetical protein JJV97_05670 [SAR324 cluster bacterium]|nr:hypothetical protein [SAR324 cluster bacterium]
MLSPFDKNKLESLLIDVGAFKELKEPCIGASGFPLFYYISIEKLLHDQGKWQKFGNDSSLMISHAISSQKNPLFKEVSQILEPYANRFIGKNTLVAGYQRRDWPFSGIYAYLNKRPHFSFYKDARIKRLTFNKKMVASAEIVSILPKQRYVFISDLLNLGSSVIDGWLPSLRSQGAICQDIIYIFSRNQGGEARLKKHGIRPHSLIKLGVRFLEHYCQNKVFCVSYWRNPIASATMYLRKNGALPFLASFDPSMPEAKKARAAIFYRDWLDKILTSTQKNRFKEALKAEFKLDIKELLITFKAQP